MKYTDPSGHFGWLAAAIETFGFAMTSSVPPEQAVAGVVVAFAINPGIGGVILGSYISTFIAPPLLRLLANWIEP